jgi:hypothetical protein
MNTIDTVAAPPGAGQPLAIGEGSSLYIVPALCVAGHQVSTPCGAGHTVAASNIAGHHTARTPSDARDHTTDATDCSELYNTAALQNAGHYLRQSYADYSRTWPWTRRSTSPTTQAPVLEERIALVATERQDGCIAPGAIEGRAAVDSELINASAPHDAGHSSLLNSRG